MIHTIANTIVVSDLTMERQSCKYTYIYTRIYPRTDNVVDSSGDSESEL